jgi:hypothetical protein
VFFRGVSFMPKKENWGVVFTISLKYEGMLCASSSAKILSSELCQGPFHKSSNKERACWREPTSQTWQSLHSVMPSRNPDWHSGQNIYGRRVYYTLLRFDRQAGIGKHARRAAARHLC